MASRFPKPPQTPPVMPSVAPAQVTRDVRSFAELQAAIHAAGARQQRGTHIRIVTSFIAPAPLRLPAVEGVVIEGLPTAVVTVSAAMDALFVIRAHAQAVRGVHVYVQETVDCAYLVEIADDVENPEVVDNIIDGGPPTGGFPRTGVVNAGDDVLWAKVVGNVRKLPVSVDSITGGLTSSVIAHNRDNDNGNIVLAASGGNCLIYGNVTSGVIDTSAASSENSVVGNTVRNLAGSVVLRAGDLAVANLPNDATAAVTLSSADPTITPGRREYIRITFGGGSSGNITLADGVVDGQRLTLFCVSYAGTATLPDATAQNVKLSAAWTPTADDTLSLAWDETDGNWIELARSTN